MIIDLYPYSGEVARQDYPNEFAHFFYVKWSKNFYHHHFITTKSTIAQIQFFLGGGGGGLQPKKTVPNLKFAVAFGFSVFFGIFRFFVAPFWFFFGLNFDKKFQPFKNHVNNEVLGGQLLPNNTLNAYKALQMSHKSYYNQQEPLNKNPLNLSKLAKMEKPKKNEKNPKKTVPNLKFAVAFGFLGCNPPNFLCSGQNDLPKFFNLTLISFRCI